MGETSNQIERQIQAERGQLGQNLNELELKVQEVTDWRAQFKKRPVLMMGVAVGSGLLLALLTGQRSRSRWHPSEERRDVGHTHRRGTDQQKDKALETFDTIKGAIIGVAAKTFQDFLGQIIPGFKEQFQKTAQEKHAAVSSADRKLAGPATSTQ
jgi:hypothetical protein